MRLNEASGSSVQELNRNVPHWRFLLVTFALVPVDSFPLFPASSQYRPVAFFLIVFYLAIILLEGRLLRKATIVVVAAVCAVISWAGLSGLLLHGEFAQLSKAVATSLIALVTLIATLFIGHRLALCRWPAVAFFLSRAGVAMLVLALPFALAQSATILDAFSADVSASITRLVSYRVTPNRVQGVSGEPAWASRYFLMSIVLITIKRPLTPLEKGLIALSVGSLVLTGSALGYLSAILYVGARDLWLAAVSRTHARRVARRALLLVGVCIGGYFLLLNVIPVSSYTRSRLTALVGIATNPSSESLRAAATVSGSIFQRVYNPIIGLRVPFTEAPFGVGPESYHLAYRSIVPEHYPWALVHWQVAEAVNGASIITSKMLYSKIVAEFGIVGLFVLLVGSGLIVLRCSRVPPSEGRDSIIGIVVLVGVLVLNFDSYIFMPTLILGPFILYWSLRHTGRRATWGHTYVRSDVAAKVR